MLRVGLTCLTSNLNKSKIRLLLKSPENLHFFFFSNLSHQFVEYVIDLLWFIIRKKKGEISKKMLMFVAIVKSP